MRKGRLFGNGRSFYHCISRVVDRQMVLRSTEKAWFLSTMRKLEAFTGLKVVTYCLMDNHFHLLVEVPDADTIEPLNEERLLELLPCLYNREQIPEIEDELARASDCGDDGRRHREILHRFEVRRGNLSIFMKELKQRFTQWYNRTQRRKGTLWEERFKSLLVEGSENSLLTVGAYIDLNPVRAGLVEDPADYKWSGYGEAVGGGKKAQQGLSLLLAERGLGGGLEGKNAWKATANRYRVLLFEHGEARTGDEEGHGARPGFSREAVEREQRREGRLPWPKLLRCRVRYFSDGLVLGSRRFVEETFEENRKRFGLKRKTGSRKMKGGDWGDLVVMRDLRKNLGDGPFS